MDWIDYMLLNKVALNDFYQFLDEHEKNSFETIYITDNPSARGQIQFIRTLKQTIQERNRKDSDNAAN